MAGLEHLIPEAVHIARINDYVGEYRSLGGGVVNDTFLLVCEHRELILRITRQEGRSNLAREARALRLLNKPEVPKLIFFDEDQLLDGHHWIIETHMLGRTPERLSVPQFRSLGKVLAETHAISAGETAGVNAWQRFVENCSDLGTETELLAHEDPELRELVNRGKEYMADRQRMLAGVEPRLIHADATPSNCLVDGDKVSLIDWEFSNFGDPMCDFSTIYYEDMDYNQGKWRIQISPEEKFALYQGYTEAGGVLDQARIDFWMNHDKLGAAVFLYWRINKYHEPMKLGEREQFSSDLARLKSSLAREL